MKLSLTLKTLKKIVFFAFLSYNSLFFSVFWGYFNKTSICCIATTFTLTFSLRHFNSEVFVSLCLVLYKGLLKGLMAGWLASPRTSCPREKGRGCFYLYEIALGVTQCFCHLPLLTQSYPQFNRGRTTNNVNSRGMNNWGPAQRGAFIRTDFYSGRFLDKDTPDIATLWLGDSASGTLAENVCSRVNFITKCG